MRRQTGFSGSRSPGNQHRAAAVKAIAAEHRIQARDAAGDALIAHMVLHAQRSNRQNAETIFIDEKGIFVGSVGRAAVFHDAQAASGDLIGYAVIEQDDAIRNIFFQSVAGERAFAAFGCDHGGYTLVFEPTKQAAQFGA